MAFGRVTRDDYSVLILACTFAKLSVYTIRPPWYLCVPVLVFMCARLGIYVCLPWYLCAPVLVFRCARLGIYVPPSWYLCARVMSVKIVQVSAVSSNLSSLV